MTSLLKKIQTFGEIIFLLVEDLVLLFGIGSLLLLCKRVDKIRRKGERWICLIVSGVLAYNHLLCCFLGSRQAKHQATGTWGKAAVHIKGSMRWDTEERLGDKYTLLIMAERITPQTHWTCLQFFKCTKFSTQEPLGNTFQIHSNISAGWSRRWQEFLKVCWGTVEIPLNNTMINFAVSSLCRR